MGHPSKCTDRGERYVSARAQTPPHPPPPPHTHTQFVTNLCSLVFLSNQPFIARPHVFITKTCLYNFDPLKPHFYIVKLGFSGVYIIFLISAQKHRLWVLVRTASTRRFERVPTICVLRRNMKNIRVFYQKIFSFLYI